MTTTYGGSRRLGGISDGAGVLGRVGSTERELTVRIVVV